MLLLEKMHTECRVHFKNMKCGVQKDGQDFDF